ncbi:hypothetical protein [Verrucomicrobium spinosum]|uniref:hypothetical protein n=1 Tax=Verrucomicrobium spinosum TaxID=2736 RepID=UPI0009467614|nr:hypothetical protein [Verrucomicrobium spinosum]
MIRRGRTLLAQKRRLQQMQQAAREYFQKHYPADPIVWVVLVEELPMGSVVAVAYGSDQIPPPCRFFRVGSSGLSITPMSPGYLPLRGNPPLVQVSLLHRGRETFSRSDIPTD